MTKVRMSEGWSSMVSELKKLSERCPIPIAEQTKAFSNIGIVCFSEEEAQATQRAFNAVFGFILGQGIDIHLHRPVTIRGDFDYEQDKFRFYVEFRAALLPADSMTGQQILHHLQEPIIDIQRSL